MIILYEIFYSTTNFCNATPTRWLVSGTDEGNDDGMSMDVYASELLNRAFKEILKATHKSHWLPGSVDYGNY